MLPVFGPTEEAAIRQFSEGIDLDHPDLARSVHHNVHHEALQEAPHRDYETLHEGADLLLHLRLCLQLVREVSGAIVLSQGGQGTLVHESSELILHRKLDKLPHNHVHWLGHFETMF